MRGMTLRGALRSELARLARSPLAPTHLACALAGGVACGSYFALAPWDPALGTDAYVQLLGAMMPLMAGIVCGVNADEERRAGRLANLTAVPSRGVAVLAKLAALWLAGAATLALAVGVFGAILAAAGRLTLGPAMLAASAGGLALASCPLYALLLAVALRWGRNVAVSAGAAGTGCALLSVGGLAHGLMTGELTAVSAGPLGLVPLAWPARLGSLAVEAAISPAAALRPALLTAGVCAVAAVAAATLLVVWFQSFEGGRDDA